MAAGALASGCGPLNVRYPRGFPIVVQGINATQAQSFAGFAHGAVDPVPVVSGTGEGTVTLGGDAADLQTGGKLATQWEIGPVLPFLRPAPGTFAPLDAALRAANFEPSALLPGTLEAFAGAGGDHYAVPAYVGAWAVQYDPQVYAEAGLKEPAPDWTIDDFEHDCAAIASAIASGKITRLLAVLPPLVGMHNAPKGRTTPVVPGEFRHAALWGAFVEGFGGTVTSDGRFDLTNTGAVTGLQRMVDIATRYGASGPAPRVPGFSASFVWHPATTTGWGAIGWADPSSPYALTFVPTAQELGMYGTPMAAKGWQWARFPILPVRNVVPLQVTGSTVNPSGQGWFVAGGAPPQAPSQSLTALADFALWWYHQYHTTPGLIGLPAPVLADAAVQRAYWSASGQAPGYPAVGDWQRFAVVEAGWPLVPGASSTSPSPVFDALTQAAEQRTPICKLLPQATQKLNAMVATADLTRNTGKSG